MRASGREWDLGNWAYRQRKKYHDGKLSKDLKKKLDDIGFDWELGGKKRTAPDGGDVPSAAEKPCNIAENQRASGYDL